MYALARGFRHCGPQGVVAAGGLPILTHTSCNYDCSVCDGVSGEYIVLEPACECIAHEGGYGLTGDGLVIESSDSPCPAPSQPPRAPGETRRQLLDGSGRHELRHTRSVARSSCSTRSHTPRFYDLAYGAG